MTIFILAFMVLGWAIILGLVAISFSSLEYLFAWGISLVLFWNLFYYFLIFYYGRYIQKHYPEKYASQLVPSNASFPTLPFPLNFAFRAHSSGAYHMDKVIEIAKVENDQALLRRVNRFYTIQKYSFAWGMILILGFVLLASRLSPQ
jgi:hypothetical protein